MALKLLFRNTVIILIISNFGADGGPSVRKSRQAGPVTCPGFPGYCSEANPGDTCLVVCAFGRNNVPECQADGTWTDAPRCIEHEPGIPEQVPGICPGIPGYCSLANAGAVCEFDCASGPDIRSFCTKDGTWDPYPTCQGDIRETKDGCDPCPGPFGGPRDREAEQGQDNSNQSPKVIQPSRESNFRQAPRPDLNVIQPSKETAFTPTTSPPSSSSPPALNNQSNENRINNDEKSQVGGTTGNNNDREQSSVSNQTKQNIGQSNAKISQSSNVINAQTSTVLSTPSSSGAKVCPGGSLESCIDVCPSFSARIFGACVAGCARRCPNKK